MATRKINFVEQCNAFKVLCSFWKLVTCVIKKEMEVLNISSAESSASSISCIIHFHELYRLKTL